MATYQFITLVACLLGVGIGFLIVAMRITARLDTNRKATDDRFKKLNDQADAERRATRTPHPDDQVNGGATIGRPTFSSEKQP